MKIRYLIDTDWVIHYLNGKKGIVRKLNELRVEGLALSVVCLAELYEGVFYSKDPDASLQGLKDFLEDVPVLDVDDDICREFGKERGRLRRQGNMIGDFDLLIASSCLSHDLILLTNNVRHFERVDGLKLVSFTT